MTITITETVTQREAGLAAAGTDVERVTALNALAWELRTTDLRRALSLSEEAVGLARAAGDPTVLAPSLCLLGGCASLLGRHPEFQECLGEALSLSRRIGDRCTEARCLHFIGRGLHLQADYAAAIESVAASVQIREETGDWAGLGASLNLIGTIYQKLCDYGQAITCTARGLEARERAGDEHGVSESLINVGCVYLEMGDYAQALVFHRRCLEQARRIGNPKVEALSLGNLGADLIGLRRYEEALEVLRRSAEVGTALGDLEIKAGTLTNMGDAHAGLGRWGEALDCYARVLEITRHTGDRDLASEVLCLMGTALTGRGELEKARERLAESQTLALSIGARRIASQAAQRLSEVCKRLGDYAAALGHHETFHRLEKEAFSEEADKRAKFLVIQMEVEHHRGEAAALAEANAALRGANEALAAANARLQALATTDPLTGLANHRALVAALDAETARCRREGGPCALLFLDIDFFKQVNDTHGHPAGDAVLREFAQAVRACLRAQDTLGRWGGEEFLALLPGTDEAGALRVAERVRAAVAARPLAAGPDAGGLPVTCSVGVAACPPQGASRSALVEAADRALYAAKRLGRNQVRLDGDPAVEVLTVPPPPVPSSAVPRRVRRGTVTRYVPRRADRRPSGR